MVERPKVGQKCFTIIDKQVLEISVDFIGNNAVISKVDDKYIEKSFNDIYPDKGSAEAHIKGLELIAICREISKNTGEVMTYVLPGSFESHPPQILKIRSRYNLELSYFFALNRDEEELEELLETMKDEEACAILEEQNILYRC